MLPKSNKMTSEALFTMLSTYALVIGVTVYLFWKILTIPRATNISTKGDRWNSRIGLVLAMAGNAVGLGNFLRFPVKAIQNGGGAFIIPYLVCFLLMGIPLLLVEWSSGKFGGKTRQHNPPYILQQLGKSPLWKYVGSLGLFTNIIVASYYIYIESWALSYAFYGIFGTFQGMSPINVSIFFTDYVALKSYIPIVSWLFCLFLNLYFLSKGVGEGIEKVARVGMPLLLFFSIVLAITGLTLQAGTQGAINDSSVGLNFLWQPDFSTIWSPKVWLAAAGQIFFTLSVGMGAVQCYASYTDENEDVPLNALSAGWMNELVEVVLGSAIIIPISVGYLGIEGVKAIIASNNPFSLGFETLPYLFQQWGPMMAAFSGMMWFGILFFAGITSSLAMGLSWTAFLKDRFDWTNAKSVLLFGTAITLVGILPVFFASENIMGEFDYWAGDVSLVLFGTLEIFLFAWVFGMDKGWKIITEHADIRLPIVYKYIIQFVTPLFLAAILISSLPNIYERLFLPVSNMVVFARFLMLFVLVGVTFLIYKGQKESEK